MAHYGFPAGGAAGDGSWGRRVGSNVVRELEDYDRTPYSGGYDITQVYGRPLAPSEETCYPITRAASATGQPRPPAYGAWGQKTQEPHAYGGAPGGGGFGKSSHPQPHPAFGFHPQQEVAVGDGRSSAGYGSGGYQPKFDYGFRPGAPKTGGYEQPPSGLGSYGYTGSGPSRRDEPSHGYGYGHEHQTGAAYPAVGYGPGRGHVEGSGSRRPQDHGHGSGHMEQMYGPVSSFGSEPPAYGQKAQRQSSYQAYQGERFDSFKYGEDIDIEEKKHHHQKYRHHH